MRFPSFFNHNTLIGVDVMGDYIKVAQLFTKGRQPEVIELADKNLVTPFNKLDIEEMAAVLTEVFAKINYSGEPVTANLMGEQLITRIVPVPVMTDTELEANMFFEAQELLPNDVRNWIIRHTVLCSNYNKKGLMQILLMAAPRQQVLLYYQAFKMAEINLTAIDIPHYALWRLYGTRSISEESYVIVNLGTSNGQLVVIRNNLIQHIRSITFKKENIIGELEMYMEIYNSQNNNYPIKKILLTGDIANLEISTIERKLDINVEIGRPNLKIDEKTNALELSTYSTAIGLALREVG